MPKWLLNVFKSIHFYEAVSANLSIIVWHFYNAHLNPDKFPMNWSWLTGKVSEEEMIKEHYREWERIKKEKR